MNQSTSPIAGTDLFALFPTPVVAVRLDGASRDALGSGIDGVLSRLAAGQAPLGRGERWETGGGLHVLPELEPLRRLLVEQAGALLERLHVEHGALEMVRCAASVCAPGVGPVPLAQRNAYLAGVYFVHGAPSACVLELEDPRTQTGVLSPPRHSEEVPDAPLARIAAAPGELLLFPAWLRHRLPGNDADVPRVVVTAALLFGEYAETLSRPKWQGNVVVGTS